MYSTIHLKKKKQSLLLSSFFTFKWMATLGNKRQLAVVLRETQKRLRNTQSANLSVPGISEIYITQQFSEEIEGRVKKNLARISAGLSAAFWMLSLR